MSDDLGFLLGDAARLLRRSFDERARAVGVTRPQWRVLALLKRFDGSAQVTMARMRGSWNAVQTPMTAALGGCT